MTIDSANTNYSEMLSLALAMADKREGYKANAKPCPSCGTDQVQLIDWANGAKWKCRVCGCKWEGAK